MSNLMMAEEDNVNKTSENAENSSYGALSAAATCRSVAELSPTVTCAVVVVSGCGALASPSEQGLKSKHLDESMQTRGVISVFLNLVPNGFKETPYSLDREDSEERGHDLWLSTTV
ncbi:hypothetical protein YC2023_109022 [Brassica napus]